jgi:glucose-specific phosphotransferase system IIA component
MLFSKKTKELYAPIEGDLVPMIEIPDQVFSSKMMGDGFAIKPANGMVYAPADCDVVMVFETSHAIGLKTKENIEILIHFGIDTVKLNGVGFDVKVKEGMKVKKGDLLLVVDIDQIQDKVPSLITPIIITSGEKFVLEEKTKVNKGEKVLSFI